LKEDFPICISHWTSCKPRFTILLFNGHCDCLWWNPNATLQGWNLKKTRLKLLDN